MAIYLKTKSGWRVRIHSVAGIRESKTFGTKDEAKDWVEANLDKFKANYIEIYQPVVNVPI